MTDAWTPRPAEPFERGNEHEFKEGHLESVKHGAYSERLLGQTISEIEECVVELVPWLGALEFRPSLRAWARAEAMAARLHEHLEEVGPLDSKGKERDALKAWRSTERLAAERRKDLGLDPSARMKLEAAFATTERDRALQASLQEGRRLRLAAESRSETRRKPPTARDTKEDSRDGSAGF